jgi:hypothetical protein
MDMHHNAMFGDRGMSYFNIPNLPSPNSRNLQGDGVPTYINLYGANAPSRQSSHIQHKNSDFNNPFMFRPHQNGIAGFNSFAGMNPMHGQHAATSQTHSSAMPPHMHNFNLGNLFSDMQNPGSGTQDSLSGISPIKLGHGNPLSSLGGSQDPAHAAAAAAHHQGYYQNHHRAAQMTPAMLNLFGHPHQHHSFHDSSRMNSAPFTAPPHGHGSTSFGLPFMHDHHT